MTTRELVRESLSKLSRSERKSPVVLAFRRAIDAKPRFISHYDDNEGINASS